VNNTPAALVKQEKKPMTTDSSLGRKVETICLDSSPEYDTFSSGLPLLSRLDSTSNSLQPLSLSQHQPYIAPPSQVFTQNDTNYSQQHQQLNYKQEPMAMSTPYIPDYNALMECVRQKPSLTVLAVNCFKIIFASEIKDGTFSHGLYNLYGRAMKGATDRKFPCDSAKVHALRDFIEDKVPHGGNKDTEWHKCQDAIHRYIGDLRRK
jgi:hypothetical protein